MSERPESITNEDLQRWSEIIDNDPLLDANLAKNPIIREVCYAGQYLAEKLTELNCPDHIIGRIMFTAGRLCFGQKDPWAIHQMILNQFMDNSLQYEEDAEQLVN
jgi:hypothetical protein